MKITRTAIILTSWLALGAGAAGVKYFAGKNPHQPVVFPQAQSCVIDPQSANCLRIMDIRERMIRRSLLVVDNKDFSRYRIEQAKDYLNLAFLDQDNQPEHLGAALRELDGADKLFDEREQFHASAPFVRDYFEVLFQAASVHDAIGEANAANSIYDQILEEVAQKEVRTAQQIKTYSVPGYTNRALMEKALIMIREGDLAEAERTLVGVVEWADREGESNPLLLWLKDQSAKDLSFINAKARLGLALVSLKSDNLSPAKERLDRVWEIPAVGRENGFMNIGLETIIYYMAICQNSSSNVEEAEVLLRTTAPWERIGNMSDLMKALELQRSQLEDPSFPLWKHLLQQIPQREYLSTDSSSQLKELTRWSKGSE